MDANKRQLLINLAVVRIAICAIGGVLATVIYWLNQDIPLSAKIHLITGQSIAIMLMMLVESVIAASYRK